MILIIVGYWHFIIKLKTLIAYNEYKYLMDHDDDNDPLDKSDPNYIRRGVRIYNPKTFYLVWSNRHLTARLALKRLK